MLADRKFIEIPPPIVPAPITPTRLMSRSAMSLAMPSIFDALRSAKKMWRSAADCGLNISFMNCSRSNCRPSASGSRVAASTHAMLAAGASWPRKRLALAAANSSMTPSCALTERSPIRGIGRMSLT